MLKNIIIDIGKGFLDTLRIDLFISHIYDNEKAKKIFYGLLYYNTGLNTFLPLILSFIIDTSTMFYKMITSSLIITSGIIHIIMYFELTKIYSTCLKTARRGTISIDISLLIIVFFYQLCMIVFIYLSNFIFEYGYLSYGINFFMLTLYHSMYTYNALWQYAGTKLEERIFVHERKWGYFFGYGILGSLLYMSTEMYINTMIYNIFIAHLLFIPFVRGKYIDTTNSYPPISLSFFSFILKKTVELLSRFIK
jgi:hypothetical protein